MDRRGSSYNKCRAYSVLKDVRKQKRRKWEEEIASQVKKHWSDNFTVEVQSSGDISAEPVSRQKIEEHFVTDLDQRNDENRPSSTSSAVAEERQDVSSKNTIDEMAEAITGGNDIGLWALWPANIPEKCRNIGWNMKQVHFDIVIKSQFLNMMFHNTKGTFHGNVPQVLFRRQNHNGEVIDISWLCISPSQTCVKCFTCRLMCADTTKCAHFLIGKGICGWKYAVDSLRSHENSMQHIDATSTFSRRRN